MVIRTALLVACSIPTCRIAAGETDDPWISRIRGDHPRLFFSVDTWPAVKERALAVHKDHLKKVQAHADGTAFLGEWSVITRPAPRPGTTTEVRDWGDISPQHRHYDAAHFTIYKQGFLALDTGIREGNTDNLQNYFAQTVAHNCILIKMPSEPPSQYWNGPVYGQAGGQNRQVGSKVIAFETGPHVTYVAGDATPVYRAEKCAPMVRQLVFILSFSTRGDVGGHLRMSQAETVLLDRDLITSVMPQTGLAATE